MRRPPLSLGEDVGALPNELRRLGSFSSGPFFLPGLEHRSYSATITLPSHGLFLGRLLSLEASSPSPGYQTGLDQAVPRSCLAWLPHGRYPGSTRPPTRRSRRGRRAPTQSRCTPIGQQGNHLHFNQQVGPSQRSDADRGARRRVDGEIAAIDLVHGIKVINVGKIDIHLHDMIK